MQAPQTQNRRDLTGLLDALAPWLWWIGGGMAAATAIGLLVWLLFGRRQDLTRTQVRARAAVVLPLLAVTVLLLLVTMPVSDTINNSLIGLYGLCIAAVITLGSTTIFANFMAGVMMHHVRSFRPGDYITIGEHSGRVTAKGMFHVEIQTEDRDLVTLPNAYLITNPVRVVRSSGTIIACEVSLGYDIPHARARALLLRAIENAGLSDGFVQIRELADFSIHYRACGLLEDTRKLVSSRTALRSQVLDVLHGDGIEILSTHYFSRRSAPDGPVIPEQHHRRSAQPPQPAQPATGPEQVIFDKAEDAERLGRIKISLAETKVQIKELEDSLDECSGEDKAEQKARIRAEIERQQRIAERLIERISRMEQQQS